jgi:hypothetical protein
MFRRPQMINPNNYWYTPMMAWSKLAHGLRDARTKKDAIIALLDISTAGVIMETDEGITATHPCDRCRVRRLECEVSPIRGNMMHIRCAHCHYTHQARCNAVVDVPGRQASADTDSATSDISKGGAAPTPNDMAHVAASAANDSEVNPAPVTNHMEDDAAMAPNEMQQGNAASTHRDELRSDEAQTPGDLQSNNVMGALPAASERSGLSLPQPVVTEPSQITYEFSLDELMAQVKAEAKEYL